MPRRSRSFYILFAFFTLFVLFLYGPILTIGILRFQGQQGGLTFPMDGVSLYWFRDLFEKQAVGDIWGSFRRSFALGLLVMVTTVVSLFWAVWLFANALVAPPFFSTLP